MDLLPGQVETSPRMKVQGFTPAPLKVLTPIRLRYVPDCVRPCAPLVCVTCESASKEVANSGGEGISPKPFKALPNVCSWGSLHDICSREWFSRKSRTT